MPIPGHGRVAGILALLAVPWLLQPVQARAEDPAAQAAAVAAAAQRRAAAATEAAAAAVQGAQPADAGAGLAELLGQAQALSRDALARVDGAAGGDGSDPLALLQATLQDQDQARRAPPPPDGLWHADPERIYVLVSASLEKPVLQRLLAEAAAAPRPVTLVWRGVLPGERLGDQLRRMARLAKDVAPPPSMEIDPRPFRLLDRPLVPVIFHVAADGTRTEARGLSGIPAFLRQLAEQPGSTILHGPRYEAAEPDLRETILAQLDPEQLRRQAAGAVARFWQRQAFLELPAATADRTRELDPTIEVTRDLLLPDGQVVAAKGTRINPLEQHPFPLALVVFDPLRPEQLAWLDSRPWPKDRRPLLIATRVDRDRGFAALDELARRYGQPVYLLTGDVKDRFVLERAPTLVTADNDAKRFLLVEQALQPEGPVP